MMTRKKIPYWTQARWVHHKCLYYWQSWWYFAFIWNVCHRGRIV